jgi:hypothetical protein
MRSCTSPLRSNSTVAPGAALPATTVSPVGSMLTTSNSGTASLPGAGGGPASALASAAVSVCAFASGVLSSSCAGTAGADGAVAIKGVLTPRICWVWWMP